MAMEWCAKCEYLIDVDEDPDATYFDGYCVCEGCRENLTPEEWAEHEGILNQ